MNTTLSTLKTLDPARRFEDDDAAGRSSRERLLTAILADRHPKRDRPLRALALLVPLAAVAAVAALVLPGVLRGAPTSPPMALGAGPLTAKELRSWNEPVATVDPDNPVATACAKQLVANPGAQSSTTVINGDTRGLVSSVIVSSGEYAAWCVGSDSTTPMYLLLDGPGYKPTIPAADSVTLGPSGARLPPNGYGFAAGRVGDDVTGVTLHEDGLTIEATVADGWWTAWWPSDDETALITGTLDITNISGRASTVTADSVRPAEPAVP